MGEDRVNQPGDITKESGMGVTERDFGRNSGSSCGGSIGFFEVTVRM